MRLALAQARRGLGLASPNPAVGAALVKSGRVVGVGFTQPAGGPHAEVVALRAAGRLARGATLYVTLEPCCHYGRTPPCTEAIVAAGVRRVVVGMRDPFPLVNGKGIRRLKRAGMAVELWLKQDGKNLRTETSGLRRAATSKDELAHEIRQLNQPFIKAVTTGLPYVTLKAAVSLDGKIATRTGDSKWITGSAARADARLERSLCDAVVVGAGTVAADDPELAAHGRQRNKKLLRVIIDGRLSSDLKKEVFRDENVFVACTEAAPLVRRRAYSRAGVEWHSFGKKIVAILALLKFLYKEKNIQSLYVEGGAGVHGAFYDAVLRGQKNGRPHLSNGRVIDKVIFYIATKIIGGRDAVAAVRGRGVLALDMVKPLANVSIEPFGPDVKVSGYFNFY